MRRTVEQRLWSKVAIAGPDDCWLWTASIRPPGYGQFWVHGRKRGPHVVALELATGQKAAGRYALHKCDVPLCINTRHLAWGTQAENVQQAYDRGRRVGVTGPRVLAAIDVLNIRRRNAEGISQRRLATEFAVGQSQISQIISRRRWGKVS